MKNQMDFDCPSPLFMEDKGRNHISQDTNEEIPEPMKICLLSCMPQLIYYNCNPSKDIKAEA